MVEPELTLAICTHNRPDTFGGLLQCLGPQAAALGIGIIVVDSASEPDAAARVAALVAVHPHVRLVRMDVPGVSIARNAALAAAETPWLGFLDDDELVPDDWVEQALALCRRLPADCGACGGNVLPTWPDGRTMPKLGWRWRQYLSMVEQAGEFDQSAKPHFVIGHGLIRVEAVRGVGGFDNRLGRDGASRGGCGHRDSGYPGE